MIAFNIFGARPGHEPRFVCRVELEDGEGISVDREDAKHPTLCASLVCAEIATLTMRERRQVRKERTHRALRAYGALRANRKRGPRENTLQNDNTGPNNVRNGQRPQTDTKARALRC